MLRNVKDLQADFCRRVYHGFCLVLLGFVNTVFSEPVNPVSAIEKEVIIVVAPDRPLRKEFLSSLTSSLPGVYRSRIVAPDKFSDTDLGNADYVVVLGSGSLQVVRDRKVKLPVIASYISPLTYRSDEEDQTHESVLFPSADWGVQMQLAQELLPQARTVAVLISPDYVKHVPELEKYAKVHGLKLEVAEWNGTENLPKVLNKLLKKSDYLLALEDSKVFNRNTVKSILLTSYRKNKVVIGPNASYVKAGSLATVWCTTDDVALAVVEAIEFYKLNQRLPDTGSLSCRSVAINKQVAKSLSITIPESIESGKLIIDREVK